MFRLRGCTCLPTERPDESTLMPLWLTATTTSLKTMRAIHCHEYGDVIEIPPSPPTHPPTPSLHIPDEITAQRLHLSSQAEAVWSRGTGLHFATTCTRSRTRGHVCECWIRSGPDPVTFSTHHTAINPGQLVKFSNLEIPQNMGVCSEFLENTGTWSDQCLNSSPHHS